jgi:hypothetical protein
MYWDHRNEIELPNQEAKQNRIKGGITLEK